MRQIATGKKHARAIVALNQFLTDHCDYSHALTLTLTFAPALALPTLTLTLLHPSGEAPDDAAQNLTTLDLTNDRSAGAMKGILRPRVLRPGVLRPRRRVRRRRGLRGRRRRRPPPPPPPLPRTALPWCRSRHWSRLVLGALGRPRASPRAVEEGGRGPNGGSAHATSRSFTVKKRYVKPLTPSPNKKCGVCLLCGYRWFIL